MTDNKDITEATKVSVTISSWWHLAVLLITIIWWGAAIKSSIDATHETAERALSQGATNDAEIRKLEMNLQRIQDQVDYMAPVIRKYIDEPAKR